MFMCLDLHVYVFKACLDAMPSASVALYLLLWHLSCALAFG